MQAFQAAWGAACKVEASTMLVPADYTFYVGPISFSGPYCKPNIVFQVTQHNDQKRKVAGFIKKNFFKKKHETRY